MSVGGSLPNECSIKEGDLVIMYPWQGCAQCELCTSGSSYLCEDEPGHDDGSIETLKSFMLIRQWQNLVKLPREISAEIGCMLPSCCKIYAAILAAKPCFEQAVRLRGFANLLILGRTANTGLQLWCIWLLKSVFCDKNVKVICANDSRDRLDEISKFGADDAVFWSSDTSVDNVVDATTMSGYNKMDVAIDLVGGESSVAIAFKSLHNGGTILELGASGEEVKLSMADLVAKTITLKAIRAGSLSLFKQLVDLIAVQMMALTFPIEFYNIEELNLAVDKFSRGQVQGYAIIKCE